MPSFSRLRLRASQLRRRQPEYCHPDSSPQRVPRNLLRLSSARYRYDQSKKPRQFEFIGLRGFVVFFLYFMRRVNCGQCGVMTEEVPWGMGKHSLTRVSMHFLGHWARKLSWKETAESFRTSWDKVHDSVQYLVQYGLEHRILGPIRAIGVGEIQYAKATNTSRWFIRSMPAAPVFCGLAGNGR